MSLICVLYMFVFKIHYYQSWDLYDLFGHIFSKNDIFHAFALFWSYFGYYKKFIFFKNAFQFLNREMISYNVYRTAL